MSESVPGTTLAQEAAGEPARFGLVAGAERIRVGLLALAASLPSLASGLLGGGFLTDDWGVWLVFDQNGLVDGLWQLAFEQPARPFAAPYYAVLYEVIGDRPVLQGLIIAAVNASLLVTAWLFGRHVLPAKVLWPTLVVFALAPNHAMTRLWFVVGTYPLALAMMFLGLWQLLRRRNLAAAGLLAAGTLVYEGVVVLAVTLVVMWAAPAWRERLRAAFVAVTPAVVVAAGLFLLSPKRDGDGPDPFDNASSLVSAHFGTGMWEYPLLAQVVGAVLLLAVVVAVAAQLPSWRSSSIEPRWLLIGVVVMLAGAAPFMYAGAVFATTGLFDRNNLVPSVGTALVLGSGWAWLRSWRPNIAAVVAIGGISWFAAMQAVDVDNFRQAVSRGDAVIGALAAAPGVDDASPIIVVPEQVSNGTGMADFVYHGDLVAAMRYRHGGDWSRVLLIERLDCGSLDTSAPVQVFNWRDESIEVLSRDALRTRCEQEKELVEGA